MVSLINLLTWDGVSCARPSGLIGRSSVRRLCIWKAWLQCASCNAWWARQILQIATDIPGSGRYRVFRLKWKTTAAVKNQLIWFILVLQSIKGEIPRRQPSDFLYSCQGQAFSASPNQSLIDAMKFYDWVWQFNFCPQHLPVWIRWWALRWELLV